MTMTTSTKSFGFMAFYEHIAKRKAMKILLT